MGISRLKIPFQAIDSITLQPDLHSRSSFAAIYILSSSAAFTFQDTRGCHLKRKVSLNQLNQLASKMQVFSCMKCPIIHKIKFNNNNMNIYVCLMIIWAIYVLNIKYNCLSVQFQIIIFVN